MSSWALYLISGIVLLVAGNTVAYFSWVGERRLLRRLAASAPSSDPLYCVVRRVRFIPFGGRPGCQAIIQMPFGGTKNRKMLRRPILGLLAGPWEEASGSPKYHETGYHLTTNPRSWWQPGARVYLAEARGVEDRHGATVVARRARLLRDVTDEVLGRKFKALDWISWILGRCEEI